MFEGIGDDGSVGAAHQLDAANLQPNQQAGEVDAGLAQKIFTKQ